MNFSQKGFILVSIPLIVGLALIAVLSVLLYQTDQVATEESRRYEILEASDRVICGVYDSIRSLVLYGFYNKNPEFIKVSDEAKKNTEECFSRLYDLIHGQKTEKEAREQLEYWHDVHKRGMRFFDGVKTGLSDRDRSTFDTTKLQEVQRQLDSLVYREIEERNRFLKASFGEKRTLTSEMKMFKQLLVVVIVGGVVINITVTLMIASFFSESFVKRIRVLTDNSRRLASTLPLNPMLTGQDELAKLDKTFHEMANALDNAARKERATITNAIDVIASIDEKLKFTAVNPASEKVWGYTAEELIGRGITDIIVPDEAEAAYNLFKKLPQKPTTDAVFDSRVRHKNGEIVYTSWSVDWSAGEESYFCVAHDITDRKLAESLIKENEARTRLIVESLPVGLLIITEDGTIDIVNRKAEQMVGRKQQEIVGEPVKAFFASEVMSGDYVDILYAADRSMEMQMKRHDDSEFPVELSMSEIFFHGDRKFLIVVADITERKELEKMKRDFVAMVSHDLRTPLTTLHGSFDLLGSGVCGDLNEKGKRVLETSEKETKRLISMINNLLDVERLDSGKMEVHKEVVEIETIVSQAINSVGYLAEKSGVKVATELEPIETFADAGSLVQVMVNLVANAIKFSPSGSTITISATETEHYIEVRVTDQGRGIPKSHLAAVFDRFQQVEKGDRENKGGSGLGLTICKAIIEAHGGVIGVESEEGKGSTFWWRLPAES